jgi:glutamate racemase
MKIGVFDSGVGGLTVLKAIREKFPNVDLYYLGDTARVPYGTRSKETVIRYSLECAQFLMDKGIDVLVVACNTASSYALDELKNHVSVPVIGVVEPGVKEALRITKGSVGVIGTRATINSELYQILLRRKGVEVYTKACPLFVPLVEEGITEGPIAEKITNFYLKSLKEYQIDTLILGCTHYPLLKKTIANVLPNVQIVDSSHAVAMELEKVVFDKVASTKRRGETNLFFTDESQNLSVMIENIFGRSVVFKITKEVSKC